MKSVSKCLVLCVLLSCFPVDISTETQKASQLRSVDASSIRSKTNKQTHGGTNAEDKLLIQKTELEHSTEPVRQHYRDLGHPTNSHGLQYYQYAGNLRTVIKGDTDVKKTAPKETKQNNNNSKHHRVSVAEEKNNHKSNIDDVEDDYKPSKHMQNKQNYMKNVLVKLLERSEDNRNFAEILPILKVMSPAQRLTMASLVTKQVTADDKNPGMNLAQVKSMFGNNSNITSDLMLPIMLDIANLIRTFQNYRARHESAPQAQFLRRSFTEDEGPESSLDQTGIAEMLSFTAEHYAKLKQFGKILKNESAHDSVEHIDDKGNFTNSYRAEDVEFPTENDTIVDSDAEHINNSTSHSNSTSEELPVAEKLRRYGRPPWARRPVVPVRRRPLDEPRRRQAEPGAALCDLFTDSLCLHSPDYPVHAITNSIRKNPSAMGVLHTDFPDISAESAIDGITTKQENKYTPEHYINNINRREDGIIRPAEASGFMCPSVVKYARPQKARATSGQWKYIVNTGEHTQTLRLEKCLRPKDTCTYLNDNFKSKCVQVYNYHRLLTWDNQNGLHMDIFKVPTCCSCHIDGYSVSFPPSIRPVDVTSERFPGEDIIDSEKNPFESFKYSIRRPPPKSTFTELRDHDPLASLRQPILDDNSPALHDLKHFPVSNQFPNIKDNFHIDAFQQDTNIRNNIQKPLRNANNENLPSFLEPPSKPSHNVYVKSPDVIQKYKFGNTHYKRGTSVLQTNGIKRPIRKPIRKKNSETSDDQIIGASNIQETPTIINADSFDEINDSIYEYESTSTKSNVQSKIRGTNKNVNPRNKTPATTERQSASSKPDQGMAVLKDISLNRRVNYNYHPIIDFFEEGQKEETKIAEDRHDTDTSFVDGEESDWRPMTGPQPSASHLKSVPNVAKLV